MTERAGFALSALSRSAELALSDLSVKSVRQSELKFHSRAKILRQQRYLGPEAVDKSSVIQLSSNLHKRCNAGS
jgi:hypothetical protein